MPIDPSKRPTDEDFTDLSLHYGKVWNPALEIKKEIDGVVYQTEDIWAEFYKRNNTPLTRRDRPSVHSPHAPALVEQAVAAHMTLQPTFHRIPNGRGPDHEEAAGRLEKGLQAVYYDSMVKAVNFPTVQNGKEIVTHNHTVLFTGFDLKALVRPHQNKGETLEDFQEREHDWEFQHLIWNPLKLDVPQPGEVLMDPRETVPGVAIQRFTMLAHELYDETLGNDVKRLLSRSERYRRNSSGKVFDLTGKDAYEPIEVEKWWSAGWVSLRRKGGEVLYTEPNMWGIQPWSQIFGGNAVMPAGEKWDVKWWIQQSLLWRELPLLRMINQALVTEHLILHRRGWARSGTSLTPEEYNSQVGDDMMFGDADAHWLEETPDLPAMALQYRQTLLDMMERTSFSSILAGLKQAGVDTATGMIIQNDNSSKTFRTNIDMTARLHTIGGSNFLKLKVQLGKEYPEKGYGRIEMGEEALDDDDIGEKYHIQASFKHVDPIARNAEIEMLRGLRQDGVGGDTRLYAALGWEDVEGERVDAIESLMLRDPMVVEQLVINAMREKELHALADMRQEALDAVIAQKKQDPLGLGQGNAQT